MDTISAYPATADLSRRDHCGLFAFATSFDEVVVVLFMGGLEQRTLPRQMWSGIREEINPTILAVATLLIIFAVLVLFTVEWLRSRTAKQLQPQ